MVFPFSDVFNAKSEAVDRVFYNPATRDRAVEIERKGRYAIEARGRIMNQESAVFTAIVKPETNLAIRALDVAVASLAIVFLAPVFLLIALCIVLTDRGPVIFSHARIGLRGKTFGCLKFRSMHVGAEEKLAEILAQNPHLRQKWEADQKLPNDPRVTAIGRILRLSSLDEIPQLFNVLRGDMSLVGPRPIVAAEVQKFGRFIEHYYSVKPGLTGLWQVTGRSSTTYRRRVATDVLYARSKSLSYDVRIIFATVPAVLLGRGSM